MDMLSIGTERLSQEVMKVTLSGSLNAMTFESLDEALRNILYDGIHCILLDIADVQQISSAGAGVLVAAKETALKAGGGLVLLHVPPRIFEILQMLGLLSPDAETSLLPTATSDDEGIAILDSLRGAS